MKHNTQQAAKVAAITQQDANKGTNTCWPLSHHAQADENTSHENLRCGDMQLTEAANTCTRLCKEV